MPPAVAQACVAPAHVLSPAGRKATTSPLAIAAPVTVTDAAWPDTMLAGLSERRGGTGGGDGEAEGGGGGGGGGGGDGDGGVGGGGMGDGGGGDGSGGCGLPGSRACTSTPATKVKWPSRVGRVICE